MIGYAKRYDLASGILHWGIGLGIILMLGFGLYVESMPRGADKTAMVQIHKSFGVIIGILALARLIWRVREGFAPPLAGTLEWERKLAGTVQRLMLLATVAMPLTGIAASITFARPVQIFGMPFIPQLLDEKHESLNELAGLLHGLIAYTLMLLIALHIAGAVKRWLLSPR